MVKFSKATVTATVSKRNHNIEELCGLDWIPGETHRGHDLRLVELIVTDPKNAL